MSDWPETRLSDVVLINPPERIERGAPAPFIEMSSVGEGRAGVQTVAEKVHEGGGAKFRAGDTLVARITPCLENGKIALVPDLGRGRVGFGSTEFIVLRGDAQHTDSGFVHYLALTEDFRSYAEQNLSGSSGRQRVSGDVLGKFSFRLPGLDDQARIAAVLGAFDDLIETNRQTIGALEQLVHTLFERAGFDQPARDTDSTTTVGELVKVNPTIAKPRGDAPYVGMAMLPINGALLPRPAVRPAQGGAKFMNGDTLLARITPCLENGKTAFVTNLGDGEVGVGSTEFIVLRGRGGTAGVWPYCLSRSPRFRAFAIQQLGDGTSGRQRLSADAVSNYRLPVPNPDELGAFQRHSAPLVDSMVELHEEALSLARERDELLPLLMSGRVRVSELEGVF